MEAPVASEWDEAKAAGNLAKHGIGFQTATAMFLDPQRLVMDASRADDGERRQRCLGAIEGGLFSLVYTMRGSTCRVISARRANRKEQRAYDDRSVPARSS